MSQDFNVVESGKSFEVGVRLINFSFKFFFSNIYIPSSFDLNEKTKKRTFNTLVFLNVFLKIVHHRITHNSKTTHREKPTSNLFCVSYLYVPTIYNLFDSNEIKIRRD